MKRIGYLGLLFVAALIPAQSASAQADSVFAVSHGGASLLRLNEDASLVVRGQIDQGTLPALGAGVRLMWVPSHAAFRAGGVTGPGTYWDLASLGRYSAAFGHNSQASGEGSFAAGLASTASGVQSVALGHNSTASGMRSFAFNGNATAAGAVAIGTSAQATGDEALAVGPSSIAGGLGAVAIGPSITNGNYAVAIGLQNSASGQFSIAIGKNARTANRQGSIVLGDGCAGFSSDSVYATANNQFVARGCGGIRFFTSQNLSSGVEVAAGGGSWSSISDRNRKENFRIVDGEDVIARLRDLPISTWNYLSQDENILHMGPMAQDFHSAFGLGESHLLINTVDIDGVNMAAIQGLITRTDHLQSRVDELSQENRSLRERLERLEALLKTGEPGTARN